MCTLCLSDMGELRDEWLRVPATMPASVRTIKKTTAMPRSKMPLPLVPTTAPLPQYALGPA